MMNLKCMTGNHEYEIHLIGRVRLAVCNKCNKIGKVYYNTKEGNLVSLKVEWYSAKEIDEFLKVKNTTLTAQAVKYVYKNIIK